MEQQILLIEDDSALGRGVAVALTEPGRIVALARDLQEGKSRWEQQSFDLVVLDLNLPDGNGLDFLRWLRQRSQVPVLILTAREEETDKVLGLELGADDYITKPFSMRELLARVKANIRRMSMVPAGKGAAASANRMELGRVTVDTDQMAVLKDGQPLQLSQREYDLIRFLAAQPGKVFSREALMEHVWDYEGYVGDVRAVDVAVRRLREKIEDDPASPKFVVTKRGMGYYFGG